MDSVGLDVGGLSAAAVQRFLTERRHTVMSASSLGELRPLLDYLDHLGVYRPRHLSCRRRLTGSSRVCDYLVYGRGLVTGLGHLVHSGMSTDY